MWYKRIVISLILDRENFTSLEGMQLVGRPTKARFADYNDISPLVMSLGIGAFLIIVVQKTFPSEPEQEIEHVAWNA